MLVFAEAITFNWPLNRSKADTEKIKRSGGKWVGCVGEGYGRFRRLIRVGLSGPGPLLYYRRIHNWEYRCSIQEVILARSFYGNMNRVTMVVSD